MPRVSKKTILLVFSTLICLIAYQGYIYLASPQVPFMDTMRFLTQIEDILKGERSWWTIYGSGEHRGLIYPFVTLIEWVFWRVDARVTTIITGFVVVATFFVVAKPFLASMERELSAKEKLVTAISMMLAALIFVSPAGFELWTLDLGFPQLLKNLFIVLYFYSITIRRSWMTSIYHSVVAGLIGAFLIIFCTYGWSYSFYAAVIFSILVIMLDLKCPKSHAVVLILILTTAQIIYVISGSGIFSNSGSVESNPFSLLSMVKAVCYGASTVFIGSELVSKLSVPLSLSFFFGLVLVCAGAMSVITVLVQRSPLQIYFACLFIFSLTVLTGVSLARGMTDFHNAGAPRYYVDLIWLLLAPLGMVFASRQFLLLSHSIPPVIKILRPITFALFLAAVVGHSITWVAELNAAPHRALAFQKMAAVYQRGVTNEEDAKLLQSPYPTAKEAVEIAQRYRLSIIRDEAVGCSLKTAKYLYGLYSPERNGVRWMSQEGAIVVKGCPRSVEIRGFIPDSFTPRVLKIQYQNAIHEIDIVPGREFIVKFENTSTERGIILLSVDKITKPSLTLNSPDTRELGILLTNLQ